MVRAFALLIVLFVAIDAALCPIVCLERDDSPSHQTSSVPAHAVTPMCGGACSSATPALAAYVPGPLMLTIGDASRRRIINPAPGPVTDIDHPPRPIL